ncbi:hypothetical protein FKM82_025053 [Ascaphus truei]
MSLADGAGAEEPGTPGRGGAPGQEGAGWKEGAGRQRRMGREKRKWRRKTMPGRRPVSVRAAAAAEAAKKRREEAGLVATPLYKVKGGEAVKQEEGPEKQDVRGEGAMMEKEVPKAQVMLKLPIKRGRGRPRLYTTGKRSKPKDHRINIGRGFHEWMALKEDRGFSTNEKMAFFLLNIHRAYKKMIYHDEEDPSKFSATPTEFISSSGTYIPGPNPAPQPAPNPVIPAPPPPQEERIILDETSGEFRKETEDIKEEEAAPDQGAAVEKDHLYFKTPIPPYLYKQTRTL